MLMKFLKPIFLLLLNLTSYFIVDAQLRRVGPRKTPIECQQLPNWTDMLPPPPEHPPPESRQHRPYNQVTTLEGKEEEKDFDKFCLYHS